MATALTKELLLHINEYIRSNKRTKIIDMFLKEQPEIARTIINTQKKFLQLQAYLQKAMSKPELEELEKTLKRL
jgi:hypothetical protein